MLPPMTARRLLKSWAMPPPARRGFRAFGSAAGGARGGLSRGRLLFPWLHRQNGSSLHQIAVLVIDSGGLGANPDGVAVPPVAGAEFRLADAVGGDAVPDGTFHQRRILGIHDAAKQLGIRHKGLAIVPQHFLDGADHHQSARAGLLRDEHNGKRLDHLPEAGLALAEGLLGAFSCGDVLAVLVDMHDLPVRSNTGQRWTSRRWPGRAARTERVRRSGRSGFSYLLMGGCPVRPRVESRWAGCRSRGSAIGKRDRACSTSMTCSGCGKASSTA